jgi:hypothetical protein
MMVNNIIFTLANTAEPTVVVGAVTVGSDVVVVDINHSSKGFDQYISMVMTENSSLNCC